MRFYFIFLLLTFLIFSCVPAKKYNDLVEKEKTCADELAKFKTKALDNEAKAATLETRLEVLSREVNALKKDTSEMGHQFRSLQTAYAKATRISETLEREIDKIKNRDARELARMQSDLEAKIIETQRKEDALIALERELKEKQKLLEDREARVKELEEIIARKDVAVKQLKEKVARALRGFTDKGLSVEERDGKIYVSLEAKLLFASGSTVVEAEGRQAIIQLAKAIEGDDELEIIVEGHTDTDPLTSRNHPRSNWELSVLRATAVVQIMTDNSAISPTILMAAGRSEYHPVDPLDKAKNRRIEVIIAPNLDELFKIISGKE